MKKKELEARLQFLNEYPNIDPILKQMGFRLAGPSDPSTAEDYAYSDFPEAMYGVEKFYHDTLQLILRFSRAKDSYEYYFISGGSASNSHTFDEFKQEVTEWVKGVKEEKLAALNAITV